MTAEFLRFLVVGGLAASLNIGSRVLFSLVMGYVPAMVLAFFVGLSTAFLCNRIWVFTPSGKHWTVEAALFTAVNLVGLVQTLLISWALARLFFPWLGMVYHPETIAHSIGVLTPIVTSYLGHKYLTFGRTQHVR